MPAIICISKAILVMWTLPFEASASQGPLSGPTIQRGTTHELSAAIKLSVVRRQQAARPFTSKFKTCSTSVFVCTSRQEKSSKKKIIVLSCVPAIKVKGNVYGWQMLKLACIFPFFQTQEHLSYGWPRVNPPSAFPWQRRAEKKRGSQMERVMPRHTAGRSEQQAALKRTARPHSCSPSAPIVRADRPKTNKNTFDLISKTLLSAIKGPKYVISN